MANIVPRLNLNKTPSIVENNSLVFAKNTRLDVDETIHRDYSILSQRHKYYPKGSLDNIDSAVIDEYDSLFVRIATDLYNSNNDMFKELLNDSKSSRSKFKIIGHISSSNEYFLFICYTKIVIGSAKSKYYIVNYDEATDKYRYCDCNWTWSGGKISGNLISNISGDRILNIAEYGLINPVPFKSINLSKSSHTDDESVYTQLPKVPIMNISLGGYFKYTIPNGVYQFFVRYKISDNNYTSWLPASKELFIGNQMENSTTYGVLKYVNTNTDSDDSFILIPDIIENSPVKYEGFQLGFILSHDDAIYARAWKVFSMETKSISFDYRGEEAEELEVIDFIKPSFQLYNVGNICAFKNKLYVSNYRETIFNNDDLQSYADNIIISLKSSDNFEKDTYDGHSVNTAIKNGETVITAININNDEQTFNQVTDLVLESFNTDPQTGNDPKSIRKLLADHIYSSTNFGDRSNNFNNIVVTLDVKYDTTPKEILDKYIKMYGLDNVNDSQAKDIFRSAKITPGPNSYDTLDPEINNITGNRLDNNIIKGVVSMLKQIKAFDTSGNMLNDNYNFVDNIEINISRKYSVTCRIPSGIVHDEAAILPLSANTDGPNIEKINGRISQENQNTGMIEGNDTATLVETTLATYYVKTITISVKAIKSLINSVIGNNIQKYTTLIPYQKYKFFVHFINEKGEITNGYQCHKFENGNVTTEVDSIEVPYEDSADKLIYPSFSGITIPDGYKACFFSIVHCSKKVATVFDIQTFGASDSEKYSEGICIEVNNRLINGLRKLKIKQDDNEVLADYYYSADTSNAEYFGANGIIKALNELNTDKLAYYVSDYEKDKNTYELIKCTPFINKPVYNDFRDLNLGGYICNVFTLNRKKTKDYYNDGSTIMRKKVVKNGNLSDVSFEELNFDTSSTDDASVSNFSFNPEAKQVNIYSNYNLNYLSLSEEPKLILKTITQASTILRSVMFNIIPSQILSDIYILPEMYRNYTRKTYQVTNNKSLYIFNNTIRSSEILVDDISIDRILFNAEDYYNIPTDKGIITNLLSIGDTIVVHTVDSMFKFTGSNSLQSVQGDIKQMESQPFDTGISEMFGSDFGFAGLQYKENSIVTENGYIFYDNHSKIIYLYAGQNQMTKLSDDIEKLLRRDDVKNVTFANDFYNNRIFVNIIYNSGESVVLSYYLLKNFKGFSSIHDFEFVEAFNTRTRCYFISNNKENLGFIDKHLFGYYDDFRKLGDRIYPYKTSIANVVPLVDLRTNNIMINPVNLLVESPSIIDVIYNTNYEIVKTVNSISWCSRFIETEFNDIDNDDVRLLRMAEDIITDNPCAKLRIYTDTCMTDLFNFGANISNKYSINDTESYKYPRYNKGTWSFNYFRNILNTQDKFKYNVGEFDNKSLIEGKYIVVRFIFDNEFKLESLIINNTYSV